MCDDCMDQQADWYEEEIASLRGRIDALTTELDYYKAKESNGD